MSKEELKNLDDQVLEVANRAGEARRSEDAQNAENEARSWRARQEEEARKEKQRIAAAQKRKALARMIARVVFCLLAVAAFVSILLVPEAVTVIGCAGVLIFTCCCAIVVDRHVRRGR